MKKLLGVSIFCGSSLLFAMEQHNDSRPLIDLSILSTQSFVPHFPYTRPYHSLYSQLPQEKNEGEQFDVVDLEHGLDTLDYEQIEEELHAESKKNISAYAAMTGFSALVAISIYCVQSCL